MKRTKTKLLAHFRGRDCHDICCLSLDPIGSTTPARKLFD